MSRALRWSTISASGLAAGLLAVNTIGGASEPPDPASIELDADDTVERLDEVRSDLPDHARPTESDVDDDSAADDANVVRPQVVSGDSPDSPNPPEPGPDSPDQPSSPDAPPESADSPDSPDGPGSADS